MSKLSENTPITGWEKWLNRIVTIALAAWAAVQYLIQHWAAKPPVP
jgi:hypothetical protein